MSAKAVPVARAAGHRAVYRLHFSYGSAAISGYSLTGSGVGLACAFTNLAASSSGGNTTRNCERAPQHTTPNNNTTDHSLPLPLIRTTRCAGLINEYKHAA